MQPISASASIDAPRERIFDLLCDLAARPAFTDHFLTEYRLARLDAVGPGASARFQVGDSGHWLDTVIEQVERPHLIREHGCGGRLNRVPSFTVWEIAEGPGPDGSELTLTFWTEPESLFDKLGELLGGARPYRRGWPRALHRLKELVETERLVDRVEVAGSDLVPAFNR